MPHRGSHGVCLAGGGLAGGGRPSLTIPQSLPLTPPQCDIITINVPLHEGTHGLLNADLLSYFKKGAWREHRAICVAEDVATALKTGQRQLNGPGYTGDA